MISLTELCGELKRTDSAFSRDSRALIARIYPYLLHPDRRTRCLLKGWKEDFHYLYGDPSTNLSNHRKLDSRALLAEYGIRSTEDRAAEHVQLLFFAIQTYFSLLMKLLGENLMQSVRKEPDISENELILGTFYERYQIHHFCVPDWYCWPVFELDHGFDRVLKDIRTRLEVYDRSIGREAVSGERCCDRIKRLYESIIPKELRHALGEFYTPGWLADYMLDRVLETGVDLRTSRVMDPTCGAGTFLAETIRRKRAAGCGLGELLETVSGLDINPLAVLTAKTGFLMSVLDLLDGETEITLPIFRADVLEIGKLAKMEQRRNYTILDHPIETVRAGFADEERRAQLLGQQDLVIGNPPWVNWEYLPDDYRKRSESLWQAYNLMSAQGTDRSFSKEDISVLIVSVVMDHLLKQGGEAAVVIRQGLFKSARNGAGFRRFQLREGQGLRVLWVEDLSGIHVFERAMTQTALFFAQKGEKTAYPVPYFLWEKGLDVKRFSFKKVETKEDLLEQVVIYQQQARPSSSAENAPWITAERASLEGLQQVLGSNSYRARTGVFTGGANAVYWLRLLDRADGLITAENLVGRAKRKAEQVTVRLEPELIYPMLKGSGLHRWHAAYDSYILCPHTVDTKIYPIPGEQLKHRTPETWKYLCRFRDLLDHRRGFAGWEKFIQQQEFHAVLRVGAYTFSPHKVVWRYIATEFICAVISTVQDPYLGEKLLLPNEKVMYVSTECEEEAYYLCGVLSSTPVAQCVKSYMNPISISTHVLDKLKIPNFDGENALHREIAAVCKEGHSSQEQEPYIRKLDELVKKMYEF